MPVDTTTYTLTGKTRYGLRALMIGGIGILGRMSIEDDVKRGTLKAISLADDGFMIHIDLLFPREGYRRVATRAFLGFLLGEDWQGNS